MRRRGPLIQLAVVALLLVASPNAAAQDITVTAPEIKRAGQVLTATEGDWQPRLLATPPSYQWSRCRPGTCEVIPGATDPSRYEITDEDLGRSLQITLTVKRIVDSRKFEATSLPEFIPVPPSNAARPTISGIAREGQVLTASPGEWRGTPPLSFGYQWRRCDEHGNCEVVQAGSDTYMLSAADVGNTVRVVVTATNAAPEGFSANSRLTSEVARAPLVNAGPPTIAGIAAVDQSLTATPGQWVTTGPIDFLYRWLRCKGDGSACDSIPGANSAMYQLRALDIGFRLRVRVTAISDGGVLTRESAPTGVVPAPAGVLAFTQSGPAAPAASAALMRPFPRVRIKGYYTPSGAVLQLLTIRRAPGARIALVCRGADCPFDRRARRGRQRVRVRSLEGSYRAGTKLTIRVTKPALIGKYTRIVIRADRAPKRRDRCLMPARKQPVRCPSGG